ncbi:phage capsid protein [Arenimonas alkanexedens]
MSNQITEAFRQAFGDNFMHVAQQKMSRLESCVTIEGGIRGMSKSINRLGQRSAQRRLTRHGDTPLNEQPHSTRFVDLYDWEDGDMVDDQDKVRTLIDPTSDYVNAMVAGMNRSKDDIVISSLGGNSRSSSGNIALPATQKIVVGGTGLTKAKIIQTKKIFRTNEADEEAGEDLHFGYSATALSDVLTDVQLTSADYLAVQMLQNGTMKGRWMGFTWVPTERFAKVSTTRFLYAWAKSGVVLGKGEDVVTRVGEDPGKGFNVRIYAKQSLGAVRVEEEKVVEVQAIES